MFFWKKELDEVSNGYGYNAALNAANPDYRLENKIQALESKVARLETKLAALTAYMGVEFRDIEAQPATVTVASLPKAY